MDLNEAVTAIGNMGLTSVNVGDYLVILNKNIDVALDEEPYISFMLFYDTTSGRFFHRIWNKTVATGKTTDLATLVKVCRAYFNRGKPCLALMKCDGQNEMPENISSACHSFLTIHNGSKVKMCSECQKTRDTITNGMREEEGIKMEDFEDINGYDQCDETPCEDAFDDAVGKDVEVGDSDKISCEQLLDERANLSRERRKNLAKKGENQNDDAKEERIPSDRPNLTSTELITEALEDGKTLYLDEVMKSISQKHTYFNVSDTRWKTCISMCLSRTSLFEFVKQPGKTKRGLWRLNTSNEAFEKCDYCEKRFPEGRRGDKYKWHMKFWHGRNNFHCSSCDFKAHFAADIFGHIEEVGHKDTLVACPLCNDNFDKAEMASHYQGCIRKTNKDRIKRVNLINKPCPTCGKVIKTKRAYKDHLMMHLREQGEQDTVTVPYSNGEKKNLYIYCDKCNKKYSNIDCGRFMLKKHVQVSL